MCDRSSLNCILRQLPLAAGFAAIAVTLLALPGTASAAIVFGNNLSSGMLAQNPAGGADAPMSKTVTFTVPSGFTGEVLCVQFDETLQVTGDSSNIGVSWNGTPLTEVAATCAQSAAKFPFASIWYLVNPTGGTNGSLMFTSTNISASYGAFTISGVATSVNPLTAAVYGYIATATTASFNIPTNGSFAVVAESARSTAAVTWARGPRPPALVSTRHGVFTMDRWCRAAATFLTFPRSQRS